LGDSIPTDAELLTVLNVPDPLTLMIRGHQCVERVLNLAISETLAEPHALEIERQTFAFKIDLAVAIGLVPKDERPAFVKVNRLRNDFAHNLQAAFTADAARELYRSFSPRLRHTLGKELSEFESALHLLSACLAVLYVGLSHKVQETRDNRVREQVIHEMVQAVLQERALPVDDSETNRKIEAEVEKQRDMRRSLGRL